MAEGSNFKHPVFVIAIIIIGGVFFLIGMAIFGWDNDVLLHMANSGFARGLITYLFAVVTIGTAVVLIVSLLTSDFDETNKERIDKGKDILSLLLGVFGTIVGFYFGSELNDREAAVSNMLDVTPLLLSDELVNSNQAVTVTAAVSGGEPPYTYRVTVGDDGTPGGFLFVESNSWIVEEINAPAVDANTRVPVTLEVEDANGDTTRERAVLGVSP